MRRTRCGEVVRHSHAFSKCATCPRYPCVHQPGSSLKIFLLSFYESFITQAWFIKSSALMTASTLSLFQLLRGLGCGTEISNPLITGNQTHSLGAIQKSPHYHRPSCSAEGLVMNVKTTHYTSMALEWF